jgi:hypothetical protein
MLLTCAWVMIINGAGPVLSYAATDTIDSSPSSASKLPAVGQIIAVDYGTNMAAYPISNTPNVPSQNWKIIGSWTLVTGACAPLFVAAFPFPKFVARGSTQVGYYMRGTHNCGGWFPVDCWVAYAVYVGGPAPQPDQAPNLDTGRPECNN